MAETGLDLNAPPPDGLDEVVRGLSDVAGAARRLILWLAALWIGAAALTGLGVPKEEFIINQVINRTHFNRTVRRRPPIGVGYDSDLGVAIPLIRDPAAKTPRVLKAPQINELVKGFGDSAIDCEARFRISDP